MHWEMKITDKSAPVQQRLVRENDELVIHSSQDCQRILDDNARLKSMGQNPRAQSAIAARVPAVLYYHTWPEEFRSIHGFHPKRPPPAFRKDAEKMWRDFFVAKLHERDFSKLRTDDRKFTANG